MYKWHHKYTDYNGNERNETFYFNFNRAELQDLEWRTPGGLENYMKRITSTLDGQALADMFKYIVQQSYGVKSDDGRRFMKSDAILKNFTETEAYSDLYILLATDDKAAADFINGVFPKAMVDAAKKDVEKLKAAGIEGPHLVENSVTDLESNEAVPKVEGQTD